MNDHGHHTMFFNMCEVLRLCFCVNVKTYENYGVKHNVGSLEMSIQSLNCYMKWGGKLWLLTWEDIYEQAIKY
jgi:hypothetical protein